MRNCLICNIPFTAPASAPNKIFCSPSCRQTYHTGCWRYGQQEFHNGRITIDDIKQAAKK